MKVAVTGATGFVGKHVLNELAGRGIRAALVSRSGTGSQTSASRHRTVRFDLRFPPIDAFQLMGEPDTLIHLAWGGLPNYQSVHHLEEELPSQYRFLKAMLDCGLRNLVVAGTCLEYGMQSGALSEDLEPRPSTLYAIAKNALRVQLEDLRQVRRFNLTWCRLFYPFGDGQAATSLLSQLRSAVEKGAKSFDMSAGDQLRDYLPVTEAANHVVSLAMLGRDVGCVNICSGVPVSVQTMVERWIKENGWSIELNLGRYPYPPYEPIAFWGDRTKLDRCLRVE